MADPVGRLESLGRAAAEQQEPLLEGLAGLERARERFLAEASQPRRRRRERLVLAAVAALGAVLAVVIFPLKREPVGFRVGETLSPGKADTWLASPKHASLPVQF